MFDITKYSPDELDTLRINVSLSVLNNEDKEELYKQIDKRFEDLKKALVENGELDDAD